MRSRDTTFYYGMIWLLKKLGVSFMKGGQKIIWWFEACFGRFLAQRGHQRPIPGSPGSQMNNLVFHEKLRHKIALWDDSTMGNWVLVPWKVVKGISDDLRHALVIFWLKGAPHGPPGSLTVLNGRPSVPWEVGIKIFNRGWSNCGKTGASCMECGQRNIWCFEGLFSV